MKFQNPPPFPFAASLVLLMMSLGSERPANAQTCGGNGPLTGPYYISWQTVDSLAACPSGDSVLAGRPASGRRSWSWILIVIL